MADGGERVATRRGARAIVGLLLLAPMVALLWVSSYTRVEPRIFGFPFFYWYQLVWVIGGAACMGGAYVITVRLERHARAERRARAAGGPKP